MYAWRWPLKYFFKWLQEMLLQDVFFVHHVLPLFHLGRIMLDIPWDFGCSYIKRHWSYLCRTGWALNLLPVYSLVCGWLHCQPRETMLSSAYFLLDSWRVFLNFSMYSSDGLVIDYPLTFFNFLEVGFAANFFRFGSHYCLWCHQVWCAFISMGLVGWFV